MNTTARLRALADCPTTTAAERALALKFLARIEAKAAAVEAQRNRVALAYWQGREPEPETDVTY